MERSNVLENPNTIEVYLNTDSGCDPSIGEYSLHIISATMGIDITSSVDDVQLVKDCIENNLEFSNLPEEGTTSITMTESGEWEDVHWHKYYVINRTMRIA